MANFAVVLSGCGFFDGAEIHESVLTLLALDTNNHIYQCFAPDIGQMHVVNHLSGETAEGETRNVLVESARIARGNIKPLTELSVNDFDAIIFPGGFGAAKNLCSFAVKGADMTVEPSVEAVAKSFAEASKPAGYVCIAPAMLTKIYGSGVQCTIGNAEDVAGAITAMGGEHIQCEVTEIVVDEARKVVTTPAYMLANRISEAATGINKLVEQINKWL